MSAKIFTDLVTLLVVIDPISIVPLYLGVTAGFSKDEVRAVALRSCIVAGAALLFFLVLGELLFHALEIELGSFQIAGGILLLIFAIRMAIGEGHGEPVADHGPRSANEIAIFPVAMPFIAGPGAFVAVVLLTENDRYGVFDQAVTAGLLVGVLVVTYVLLRLAAPVSRLIGTVGASVVSRIMGMILTALAVQYIVNGVHLALKHG